MVAFAACSEALPRKNMLGENLIQAELSLWCLGSSVESFEQAICCEAQKKGDALSYNWISSSSQKGNDSCSYRIWKEAWGLGWGVSQRSEEMWQQRRELKSSQRMGKKQFCGVSTALQEDNNVRMTDVATIVWKYAQPHLKGKSKWNSHSKIYFQISGEQNLTISHLKTSSHSCTS